MVLATLKSSPKLTVGQEDIDVVVSDEALSETNDGASERCFTVVIGCYLGNGPDGLSYFDLAFVVLLEEAEEDLALARLEAVDYRGD